MAESAPSAGRWALAATILMLVNLMLLPGLAFVALAWLYLRRRTMSALECNHVAQAFWASVIAGMLIIVVIGGGVAIFGLASAGPWVALILYFTCVHATLILLGLLALVHAINGKPFRYPLFGALVEARFGMPARAS